MLLQTPFGTARDLGFASITQSGRVLLHLYDWQVYNKSFHEQWGFES